MCGIAGIVAPGGEASREAAGRMVAALRHRGPDGSGVLALPGCALGHARLSIIDLECGAQPMSDPSGRWHLVFNGELYNFRELRAELAARGRAFATRSDTEVVMAAYAEWGAACLHRFRGMFAFVLWDAAERRLFAARDLFGEKPLYWARGAGGSLAFASELKSLLASGVVAARLDPGAVDAFLALGYVPPERTVYAGVHTLPPAHFLEWGGGEPRVERWWAPRLDARPMGLDEAAGRLRELTAQAVRRQLVADVPVGAFLSGGLDSSTIVAMMREVGAGTVRTFSVGFGPEIDELPYARAVAGKYGTEHHEIDLGTPPVAPLLERMAEVYDEPFADSSHVPTFLISEFARRHVKVVLSGDGGDELFGGYSRYLPLALSEEVSGSLAAWAVLRLLSRASRERVAGLARRSVAVGMRHRWPDMWTRAVQSQVSLREGARRALWGPRAAEVPAYAPGAISRPGDETRGLDRAFYFDLTSYLPGDILVKVDRASMAHGLETRAPFLDRDLAEFALSLPASLKVSGGETKRVMRHAFSHVWPEALRGRPKQGFGAPYRAWLGFPAVREQARRVFAPGSPLLSLLPGAGAYAGGRDYRTWTLLSLGLWLERRPEAL